MILKQSHLNKVLLILAMLFATLTLQAQSSATSPIDNSNQVLPVLSDNGFLLPGHSNFFTSLPWVFSVSGGMAFMSPGGGNRFLILAI